MKFVIYKINGNFYVTTKQNYESAIQDEKKITVMIWEKGKGRFKTKRYKLKDWEKFCKNIKVSRDDFTVIRGN